MRLKTQRQWLEIYTWTHPYWVQIVRPPHYIILDLLLNTPVFTGFHKVHTEQMQAGTTSSASSGEKCVRQSQRPVVFG